MDFGTDLFWAVAGADHRLPARKYTPASQPKSRRAHHRCSMRGPVVRDPDPAGADRSLSLAELTPTPGFTRWQCHASV
jgi:hypothetical protein